MSKTHRTALVIDITEGFAGSFAERANRLIQSVGGDGQNQGSIKVDIYTWDGHNLVKGRPGATEVKAASADLDAAIAELGYEQVVVSKPGV